MHFPRQLPAHTIVFVYCFAELFQVGDFRLQLFALWSHVKPARGLNEVGLNTRGKSGGMPSNIHVWLSMLQDKVTEEYYISLDRPPVEYSRNASDIYETQDTNNSFQ